MALPKIYNYHPKTGEFLGEGTADPSPMEPGKYLVPGFATTEEPPAPQAGFVPAWIDGKWIEVEDHRGEIWWDGSGAEMTINQIGDPKAYGLTNVAPPPPPPPPVGRIRFALVYRGVVVQTIEWDASSGAMRWQNSPDCQMLLDEDAKAEIGQPFGPTLQ